MSEQVDDFKDAKFYAAILHQDGDYRVDQFNTLDELVTRLKDLVDRDVSVFTFAGTQLRVSKPPFRHLLTPWGAKPLFDIPSSDFDVDDTGYLGVDPIHLSDPPELKTPLQSNKDNMADDFFDDKDDGGLGVFDSVLPDPDS